MRSKSEAQKLAVNIKRVACDAGANLVGIVTAEAIDALPPVRVGWKYQEYTKKTADMLPNTKSIVVMGYHVWDDALEIAIRKNQKWVYPGYFPLPVLALTVINHLEKKGYRAVMADLISYKRLAQLAGFGNYGKNALIVNPEYGPWIRLIPILTNAEMTADEPFDQDLCGECQSCIRACPTGALTPYKVDDAKCLVGFHITSENLDKYSEKLAKYEPSLTKNAHIMCVECQKACRYGKTRR
ncbi:MAG: 4Fe-4S double cluster binding domain-containing protein [Anaerolineae bacterium]